MAPRGTTSSKPVNAVPLGRTVVGATTGVLVVVRVVVEVIEVGLTVGDCVVVVVVVTGVVVTGVVVVVVVSVDVVVVVTGVVVVVVGVVVVVHVLLGVVVVQVPEVEAKETLGDIAQAAPISAPNPINNMTRLPSVFVPNGVRIWPPSRLFRKSDYPYPDQTNLLVRGLHAEASAFHEVVR